MNHVPSSETADARWFWLYTMGGAAALLSAIFLPIQVIVFIVWPPPIGGPVVDWFTLFQNNWLVGLIDLDLLIVADNVLLVPLLLAFYLLLRRTNKSVMAVATALGFLAIVLFITSNPAFEVLALSKQYAAATTDAQRAMLLAAGQAMLATWQGTSFQVAYLLGSVAGIAFGFVMLESGIFSKLTGYMAILANAVGLGLYVPVVGIYIAIFSVLFLEVWYVLVARKLLQLGRANPQRRGGPVQTPTLSGRPL